MGRKFIVPTILLTCFERKRARVREFPRFPRIDADLALQPWIGVRKRASGGGGQGRLFVGDLGEDRFHLPRFFFEPHLFERTSQELERVRVGSVVLVGHAEQANGCNQMLGLTVFQTSLGDRSQGGGVALVVDDPLKELVRRRGIASVRDLRCGVGEDTDRRNPLAPLVVRFRQALSDDGFAAAPARVKLEPLEVRSSGQSSDCGHYSPSAKVSHEPGLRAIACSCGESWVACPNPPP
jgi:hypothetical protein